MAKVVLQVIKYMTECLGFFLRLGFRMEDPAEEMLYGTDLR